MSERSVAILGLVITGKNDNFNVGIQVFYQAG